MKFVNASLMFVTALGTAALFATPAAAQQVENIVNQGQFVIGAERIAAFTLDKITLSPDEGDDTKISQTNIALLGNPTGATYPSPSSVPRFGFDYLVTDGLSIGASF